MRSTRMPRLHAPVAARRCLGLGLAALIGALGACDDGALAPGYSDAAAPPKGDAGAVDAPEQPTQTAACPPPVNNDCPGAAVPSFAATILPILDASCNGCHDPTVVDGPWPLVDHDDIFAWRASIVADLRDCSMPPAAATVTLPELERQQIFTWIACGAPNN